MTLRNTSTRFGPVAQTFHWLTVILVAGAYVTGLDGPPDAIFGAAGEGPRRLHESLGFLVLIVTALRLIWRAGDGRPKDQTDRKWMAVTGRVVQWFLFGLLVAVPLTAIVGLWLGGHPLSLYGTDVSSPFAGSVGGGEAVLETHKLVGNVILWLAGLHAAAALFHHYVLKDGVLAAMLPWR